MLGTLLLALASLPAGHVPDERPLVERAWMLRAHGRPLEAVGLLQRGLESRLAPGGLEDERARVAAELEAMALLELVTDITAWSESSAFLERTEARRSAAPASVRFWLACLEGEVARGLGRLEQARRIFTELGYLDDWLVIGPFPNERGGGLERRFPPEEGVDPEATLPGREHPVRWRANPARDHPLLRVSLTSLFDPPEHAVAFLATAVEARSDHDLVLRLSTTAAYKVFLNGRELAARDVERPRFADQDRIMLPLAEGWNELLLKLAVEDGPWTVEARLTEPDGEPVRPRVDPGRLRGAREGFAPARDEGTARAPIAPEARDRLAEWAGEAWAARGLCIFHLIVHPDDRTGESDLAAARAAVELEPDDPVGRDLLARSLEPEAAERTEMAIAPYVDALEAALAVDPGNLSALLRLCGVFSSLDPLPDRVDELTRRALELAPDSWTVAQVRAQHLRLAGRGDEAQHLLRRASEAASSRRHPGAAARRAETRLAAGEPRAALAELLGELERSRTSPDVARAALSLLVDLGRWDDAAELARQALAVAPFADDLRREAARLFEHGGRPELAREWIERSLELCPEGRSALEDLARLEERAGNLAAAGSLLERVLELDPGDDRTRRRLRVLLRGSGSAAGAGGDEDFEAPWRRDASQLVDAPRDERLRGEPLEVLDRTVVWRVHADGAESRYEHLVVRVLGQAGVQALDHLPLVYPVGGRLKVHAVRVLSPDGRSLRAPAPAADRRRGEVVARTYDLPPLAPGDVVDLEYRVDETEPDVFGRYFGTRHTFYSDQVAELLPTRRSELVVLVPPGVELFAAERNAQRLERESGVDVQGRTLRRWVAHDLPRPPLEGFMPRREELAPVVDLTTYASWDEFGRWWWSFISKEFDSSPAMERKVAELTEGLPGERERVEAILRFVAQDIRYNAWPFGTHGYEPYSASTIFERRFGDCKDKSILLRQMLAMIGVEALPVLVRAQWRRAQEPLAAAMVEHFNHCIAWVTPTAEREGYWLDATADRNPPDYLRADVQGARVLHVGPQGTELHDIPYTPAAENVLWRTYDVRLAADGSAEVALVDESRGQYGVQLRYRFGGRAGGIEDALAADLNEGFGAIAFESIETSDLEDITLPARLSSRFTCRELGTRDAEGLMLPLGFDPLGLDGVAVERPQARSHDLVLDRPYAIETLVRWSLPAGARLTRRPEDARFEAPGLARYELTVVEGAQGVEVRRRFDLLRRRFSPDEYPALRNVLESVRQAEARTLGVLLPDREQGR